MALGGGTYLVQNKVLPGAYINFVSQARALGNMGERGTVAFLLRHNWGAEGALTEVEVGDFQKECRNIFGYAYQDPEMLLMREVFKGAQLVKFYRPKGGAAAKVTVGNLTATAKYGGTRGNALKIVIERDIDDNTVYTVKTLLNNEEVDYQSVTDVQSLAANGFVTFSGTGAFETVTAGTALIGGTDKEITGTDYSDFLAKIETDDTTAILYDGDDDTTKGLFYEFVKRLRDDDGIKLTVILHDYAKPDYEGVISVKNTVEGDSPAALVYWVAGKSAGANVNESLTNRTYDGEMNIHADYKKSEYTKFLEVGEFVFYGNKAEKKVLKDINTFTSYVPTKNGDFSNNQVMRVLDQIAVDTARIFDQFYLGKVQNNDTGRNLFKAELIHYHDQLQSIEAITNFTSDDIVIAKGVEKGDVIVEEAVEPVGSMEKLFMQVTVV